MKIKFTNDWQYLFRDWAIGGRFANFTIIHIGWLKVNDEVVDGFSVTLLGLGVKVSKNV